MINHWRMPLTPKSICKALNSHIDHKKQQIQNAFIIIVAKWFTYENITCLS